MAKLRGYIRLSSSQRFQTRHSSALMTVANGLNVLGLEDGGLGGEALLQFLHNGVHVWIGLCRSPICLPPLTAPAVLWFCSDP